MHSHQLLPSAGCSDLPTTPTPWAISTEQGRSLIPRPHRHHVVLQLLQPHAALVAATAGSGQAVVGPVEGG